MQYTKKRQKPDSFRTIGTCLKQISVSFNLRRQQSKSISARDPDGCSDNPSSSATGSRPSESMGILPVWFRPDSRGAYRLQ